MIPLRLTLKNFMCYQDRMPSLELEGIHIACLCGDNGHGKTALLDAMTWALWGKARAKTQDELIYQGQMDMAVELEFMARDQRYSVSRRHSKARHGRGGATVLELQVTSNGTFRPITGNSVEETERKIRNLLHMDYETFVSSAFLLQGKADLFTTSRPAERKEVLGKILDLSYYDQLEAKAKERSNGLKGAMQNIQAEIQRLEREIEKRPEYESQLTQVNEELQLINPQVEGYKLNLEAIRRSLDYLNAKEREMEGLRETLASLQKETAHYQGQFKSYQDKVAVYETIMRRGSEIRKRAGEQKEAQGMLEKMNTLAVKFTSLTQNKVRLESEIKLQREQIRAEVRQIQIRMQKELEPIAGRREMNSIELAKAREELSQVEKGEKDLNQGREMINALSLEVESLKRVNANLHEEMKELRTKFDLLSVEGALCPLCKKPLGPEGREHLRGEYETQGREAKRAYLENEAEIKKIEKEHGRLDQQARQQELALRRRRIEEQTRIIALERGLEEAKAALTELGILRRQADELQVRLDNAQFAQEQQKQLAKVEQELLILGYDPGKHQTFQEQVKALEPYAELHHRLVEAEQALPNQLQEIKWVQEQLENRRQRVNDSMGRQATLEEELKQLPGLRAQLSEAQDKYKKSSEIRDSSIKEQGALEQKLMECAQSEEELNWKRQDIKKHQDKKSIYDELALAFGKNGIQALIIENAIPQLENEANELLARLTDNRMALKMETQRERKTRAPGSGRSQNDSVETLEIRISDDLGTRSYETFSGGESFRINFALRIALSKLLARRAGAPLPTLFIDEGFGTQDSSGRERLLEAIKSIEKDFEKIFVITHIEELKDAFPVRIEVTKTEAGSTFKVT
ncbi:MAG: SMC family ATPase [Chloroflexi bacterium]|nr:SMC family ATPase [Chloroflexota bacterium]